MFSNYFFLFLRRAPPQRLKIAFFFSFLSLGHFCPKGYCHRCRYLSVRLSICPSVCNAVCLSVMLFCEHNISSPNVPRLTKFAEDMHLLKGQVPIENLLHNGHLGFSRWPPFKNLILLITQELHMIERKTQQVCPGLGLLSVLKLFSNFQDGSHIGFSRWPPFKT